MIPPDCRLRIGAMTHGRSYPRHPPRAHPCRCGSPQTRFKAHCSDSRDTSSTVRQQQHEPMGSSPAWAFCLCEIAGVSLLRRGSQSDHDVIGTGRLRIRYEKRHRYVSTCGPLPTPFDEATARAIAAAENEGWPLSRIGPVNATPIMPPSSRPARS